MWGAAGVSRQQLLASAAALHFILHISDASPGSFFHFPRLHWSNVSPTMRLFTRGRCFVFISCLLSVYQQRIPWVYSYSFSHYCDHEELWVTSFLYRPFISLFAAPRCVSASKLLLFYRLVLWESGTPSIFDHLRLAGLYRIILNHPAHIRCKIQPISNMFLET